MSEQDEPIHLRCCPFLGAPDDKDLVHNYPTAANVCRAAGAVIVRFWIFPERRPYRSIPLSTQKNACLSDDWIHCPIYNKKMQTDTPKQSAGARP